MSDVDITLEETPSKGCYGLVHDGHEAEVTYSILSRETRIADHTGVPDALRGSDAGVARVTWRVADAHAEGCRIVPLCPFVNARRRRHPDWANAFDV